MLEVKVVPPEADQLGPAGARVKQQHEHGRVPASVEVLASTGRAKPPQRLIREDGDRLLGDGRRLQLGHRVGRGLAFVLQSGVEHLSER